MSALVSICIPTYRQTFLLKENLDSICRQTFQNLEVIVSDDTPGDEVKDLVSLYQSGLPIQYFHHEPSLGSPANWNFVLKKAKGDYVILLHHDDQFAKDDALEKLLKPFQNNDVDFVFGRNETIDAQPKGTSFNKAYWSRVSQDPTLLTAANLIGAPSNVLIKKEALAFYDEKLKWIVDVEYYTRMIKAGKKMAFVNEHLVKTGRHEGQITNLCLEDKMIQVYENIYYAKKHIDKVRHVKVYDFYWRLLRNTGIRSIKDIEKAGVKPDDVPYFIKKIVAFQGRLPREFLQVGPVSKLLMTVSFVNS